MGETEVPSPASGVLACSFGARLAVLAHDEALVGGLSDALQLACIESRPLAEGADDAELDSPDETFHLERVCEAGAPVAREPVVYRLRRDADELARSHERSELYRALESELHFSVASHARTALFVHAGVVAWRERAILIPGRSMSGKTTLVQALLRAGAAYFSDEYAVIDEAGLVHPFPRSLGVRGADGVSQRVAPETLACEIGTDPLPAGLVLSTRFEEGATFAPTPNGSARGLMTLLDNTVIVRERSSFALDRLTPVAQSAATLEGLRGDADEAAASILAHPVWAD